MKVHFRGNFCYQTFTKNVYLFYQTKTKHKQCQAWSHNIMTKQLKTQGVCHLVWTKSTPRSAMVLITLAHAAILTITRLRHWLIIKFRVRWVEKTDYLKNILAPIFFSVVWVYKYKDIMKIWNFVHLHW